MLPTLTLLILFQLAQNNNKTQEIVSSTCNEKLSYLSCVQSTLNKTTKSPIQQKKQEAPQINHNTKNILGNFQYSFTNQDPVSPNAPSKKIFTFTVESPKSQNKQDILTVENTDKSFLSVLIENENTFIQKIPITPSPIPTKWPNAKIQDIPTTWDKLETVFVDAGKNTDGKNK